MNGLPTKEIAQKIFDAHLQLIWDSMLGQVTDIEEFNRWSTKIAAAHTSTTLAFLFPHDPDAQHHPNQELVDLTKFTPKWN